MQSLKSHLRPTNSYQDPRWFIGTLKRENHWLGKSHVSNSLCWFIQCETASRLENHRRLNGKAPYSQRRNPGWQLADLEEELAQVLCCKPRSGQINITTYKTTTQRGKLTALVRISKNSNIHMRNWKLKTTLLECSVLPPQSADFAWHIIKHLTGIHKYSNSGV